MRSSGQARSVTIRRSHARQRSRARQINRQLPGKSSSVSYAYNYHSPPPIATVDSAGGRQASQHPFIIGGPSRNTPRRMVETNASLAFANHYPPSIPGIAISRDLPARSRGQLALPESYDPRVPRSRRRRFLSGRIERQTGDPRNWAITLPRQDCSGYRRSKNVDALTDDFLFHAASVRPKEPMARVLSAVGRISQRSICVDDQVDRMFRSLDEGKPHQSGRPEQRAGRRPNNVAFARAATTDCGPAQRLRPVYPLRRSVHRYWIVEGGKRQSAFETMLPSAYRMRRFDGWCMPKRSTRDVDAREQERFHPPRMPTWMSRRRDNPGSRSEPFTLTEFRRHGTGFFHQIIATLETCLKNLDSGRSARRFRWMNQFVSSHVCRGDGEVR